MPTARNARGADLYVASEDESIIWPLQVKTHSGKPEDTALGLDLNKLVTPWWVFVVGARADIKCYLLHLCEVKRLATRDPGTRSGKPEHERKLWLNRKYYTPGHKDQLTYALDNWQQLGTPRLTG